MERRDTDSSDLLSRVGVRAVLAIAMISCGGGPLRREEAKPRDDSTQTTQGAQDTSLVRSVRAEVFCSEIRRPLGAARLSWISRPDVQRRQTLQITVYKRGLEQGVFATADLAQERVQFRLSPGAAREKIVAQALEGLTLTTRGPQRDSLATTVQIDGLQSGGTYFWRLVTSTDRGLIPTPTQRFEALGCPME